MHALFSRCMHRLSTALDATRCIGRLMQRVAACESVGHMQTFRSTKKTPRMHHTRHHCEHMLGKRNSWVMAWSHPVYADWLLEFRQDDDKPRRQAVCPDRRNPTQRNPPKNPEELGNKVTRQRVPPKMTKIRFSNTSNHHLECATTTKWMCMTTGPMRRYAHAPVKLHAV